MTVRITGSRARSLPRTDRRLLRSRAVRMLRELGHSRAELSLSLVNDVRIAELNEGWRGKSGPTDVLAFPLLEGEGADSAGDLLGDVVIGIETAASQARRARRSLDDEVARLMIHGTLHLLGHDHEQEDEAREMRSEERRLWRVLRG